MNKVILIVMFVGIIAIVLGFLIHMGVSIYKSNELDKNTKFPPWPAKCPDYWNLVSEDDNGEPTCQNVKKIGDCRAGDNDNIMDFNESIFSGTRGMYYKCNWAKKCNVPWEGIDSLC